MKKYIGCDMHKKYSVFVAMDETGKVEAPVRVANDSLELDAYLKTLAAGSPVAVEASGGWYWFVDRLEEAGAERLGGPVETPWRHLNIRLRAPDGMQLTLFTVLDE